MKRIFLLFIIVTLALPLGGCAGIYANTREVEQLLVIQTMGLDADSAGVRLSLASGAGVQAAGSPSRLHGTAPTITAAIERIRSLANEDDLFCAHISHVLLGEETARGGVEPCLSYICRSPDLRISVPLYVVRGGSAEDAVLGVGDDSYGICDALDSVDSDVRLRGDGSLSTAADIVGALEKTGSALICAVDYTLSAEDARVPVSRAESKDGGEEKPASGSNNAVMTVAAAGYGVLKEGKLCAWIGREQAVAVGLLLGDTGPCEILLRDRADAPVTLELNRGKSTLTPLWADDGSLEGLEILVEACASVAEHPDSGAAADEAWEDDMTARFEAELSDRIGAVLRLSKALGADFLDLGGRVEMAAPARSRTLAQPFAELLPQLPIRLSVSGRLEHTNDVKDGAA